MAERTCIGKLERPRGWLLLGCLIAQAATVGITWPLWQLRETPPHLPALPLPPLAMGWLMLGSLILPLLWPAKGLAVHATVLVIASLLDQMRLQPQFYVLVVLMAACVFPVGLRAARWFLASTWLWAGLHKLLSPDWFGPASWWMVERLGLDPEPVYLPFAWGIALGELTLGLLACFRPRWGVWLAVALHGGIVLTLSPWGANWNESVIPWNLAMGIVGGWILHARAEHAPAPAWEKGMAVLLLLYPIGFYGGWVDHGFAGVLYSDNLPRGQITTREGTRSIRGWGALAVPFPNERRLLRQHFSAVAQAGEKLHLSDPRPWLDDQYFLMGTAGQVRPIDAPRFFASRPGEVAGIGLESRRSLFYLGRAGVRLLRATPQGPIYAAAFSPEQFAPEQIPLLKGLPNLEQLQCSETGIRNADLRHLQSLHRLTAIELFDTPVTAEGLQRLKNLPCLEYIGHASQQPGSFPKPP